jgi:hypothetical protein
MSVMIFDVAEDISAQAPAFAASGFKTGIGYLSSINPTGAKCLTVARVKTMGAAGLRVGLVHEGYGGVNDRGISSDDGARDGAYCRKTAPTLGAPKGACIYFACDMDFTAGQIALLVVPYFTAIRAAFADKFYRVGVYGSGAACAAVMAAGLADLSWEAQSKGWTNYSAWLAKANMLQGAETHFDGVDIDTDTAQGDIGDFVPFSDVAVAQAPAPFHTPSKAALDAGFTAGRAAVNKIAGSWSSWISDDAVRLVVSAVLVAADKADG